MISSDVNAYPIVLLVNYWEIHPSQIGPRLNELLRRGYSHFATFVPWQATESDISHSLTRLLQAVSERKMTVSLIVSPEVGVHYPNSGLPKDGISNPDHLAHHVQGGEILATLPPHAFGLPSYFSPEFSKRYYGFLSRLDGYFSDLTRTQPDLLKFLTVVLSGSFWKYYRSPALSSQRAFGGQAGDYSSHSALAFRQRMEQFYSQREFCEPTQASANRWKTRSMEETNRKWFNQQAEDVFRSRSSQAIRKRTNHLKLQEVEIYTPEADPSLTYSNFLRMVSGGVPDFVKISELLDEAAARVPSVSASRVGQLGSFIHWASVGGFRRFTEAQRQFLIFKTLLLFGPQGGGILIDYEDWFKFSHSFRMRVESISKSIVHQELQSRNQVLYLTSHLWSPQGTLWEELGRTLGNAAKMISSIELLSQEKHAHLVVVDPSFIVTQDVVQRLVAWARAGRIVVLPQTHLYTEPARRELEQVIAHTKKIDVDLGLSYRLHSLGEGKFILFDVSDQFWMKGEPLFSWQGFLKSILSVAEIETPFQVKDPHISILPFEVGRGNFGLFLLNGYRQPALAEVQFQSPVQIGDLTVALAAANAAQGSERMGPLSQPEGEGIPAADRFSLEIPAYGILPLSVDGLNWLDLRERQIAAMTSQFTKESVLSAAASELPGFNQDESAGSLWN